MLRDVAAGDVDGDGVVDLAWIELSLNLVEFRTGQGDGSFAPSISLDAPWDPFVVEVADPDDDAHANIVVLLRSPSRLAICRAGPSGPKPPVFIDLPSTSPSSGSIPVTLCLGDLFSDGFPDWLMTFEANRRIKIIHGTPLDLVEGSAVFMGAGDSTQASRCASGDLNGAGYPDLLHLTNLVDSDLSVRLSDGLGSFEPLVTYSTENQFLYALALQSAIRTQDLTGDGAVEVFIPGARAVDDTLVFQGAPDGSLGELTSIPCVASACEESC